MILLNKHWKKITLFYGVIVFLILVVYKGQPIASIVKPYLAFFVLSLIIFLGNTIGTLGLLIQQIFKNEDLALGFYKVAYLFKPTNPAIFGSYGLILLRNYDYTKAKEIFQKGLTFSTYFMTEKMLRVNITLCDWKLGNIQKSLKEYETIMKDFNSSFINEGDYTTIGYLYMLSRQYEDSESYTNQAIEKNPEYASAYDNLGQIYLNQGQLEKAKQFFKKALEVNPHLADSHYFLGVVYEQLGDLAKARASWLETLNCPINGLCTVSKEEINQAIDGLS